MVWSSGTGRSLDENGPQRHPRQQVAWDALLLAVSHVNSSWRAVGKAQNPRKKGWNGWFVACFWPFCMSLEARQRIQRLRPQLESRREAGGWA